MESKGYDFSRLPKKKHKEAIEAVKERNIVRLKKLHDQYKLSTFDYKCCGLDGLITWFTHGIENGEITTD